MSLQAEIQSRHLLSVASTDYRSVALVDHHRAPQPQEEFIRWEVIQRGSHLQQRGILVRGWTEAGQYMSRDANILAAHTSDDDVQVH